MALLNVAVDTAVIRHEYVSNGLSINAIANKYGWAVNTVHRRLASEGVQLDSSRQFGGRTGTGKYPLLGNRAWLKKQLRTKTMLRIAEELGTTSGNVSDFVKRHGLRLADTASEAISIGRSLSIPGKPVRQKLAGIKLTQGANNHGYRMILKPEHPFATRRGYVMEHRLVAEKKLGRFLTKREDVHHIDGNKQNNQSSNLMVVSRSEHRLLHGVKVER